VTNLAQVRHFPRKRKYSQDNGLLILSFPRSAGDESGLWGRTVVLAFGVRRSAFGVREASPLCIPRQRARNQDASPVLIGPIGLIGLIHETSPRDGLEVLSGRFFLDSWSKPSLDPAQVRVGNDVGSESASHPALGVEDVLSGKTRREIRILVFYR
jgi:hypothetical protein